MPVIFFAVKAADIMACEALLAKGADTSIQLEPKVCEINYNSRQKSGDTLHFFILHLVFIPLLPPNNVVFWENYKAVMEKFHMHNNVKCLIDETTLS